MTKDIFKKSILFSIFGHLAMFGIFSFSFGSQLPKPSFAAISCWGAILGHTDIANGYLPRPNTAKGFFRRAPAHLLDKTDKERPLIADYYLKPPAAFTFNVQKPTPQQGLTLTPPPRRKEQTIMFHPQLPYHFLLFFKDRQAVHIELMFNLISSGKTRSLLIKRKISSGNLEADLLSMRYISRYLFMEQRRLLPDNWQAIKIDLSAGGVNE